MKTTIEPWTARHRSKLKGAATVESADHNGPAFRIRHICGRWIPIPFPTMTDCLRAAHDLNREFPIKELDEDVARSIVRKNWIAIKTLCFSAIRW